MPPYSWPALEPPYLFQASAEEALSGSAPCGLPPLWRLLLLSDGSVTRHLQLLTGSPVTVECLSMRNVGWSVEGFPPGVELIPGPRVQRQVLLRCRPRGPGVAGAEAVGGTPSGSGNGSGNVGTAAPAGGSSTRTAGPSDGGSSRAAAADASAAAGRATEAGGGHVGGSGGSGGNAGASGMAPVAEAGSAGGASTECAGGEGGGGGGGAGCGGGVPLVYASSWWNAGEVDQYLRDRSKPIWISLSQGHVELYREVHALFAAPGPPELERLLGCPGPFWGRHYIFWSGGRPLTLIYEVFSPRLGGYVGVEPGSASGAHGRE
ncbi:hypothetical protein TSOC_012736 [Tetrabaena socialis]|uniref:Uncharacterized protein n=1 Tax=Tetrabaena socialis TaxID=47790 RepID=A0A2J7ZM92_9CHLO|nr:hypothetical protein TSOC_012736 [Tetrabaena socialis]|eukprot:PNH01385.1 hypothetical protein TSOC_012736 [Tetrabaena socialis]